MLGDRRIVVGHPEREEKNDSRKLDEVLDQRSSTGKSFREVLSCRTAPISNDSELTGHIVTLELGLDYEDDGMLCVMRELQTAFGNAGLPCAELSESEDPAGSESWKLDRDFIDEGRRPSDYEIRAY